MEKIAQESSVYLYAIPQIIDVYRIVKETKVPVFSPHLDNLTQGRGTGHILPEAVKEAGAVGVLLNHAEKRLPLYIISETIKSARVVGLISMVASSSPKEAENIASLGPDVIIAGSLDRIGTLKSIARDREFVVQSVKKVKTVNPDVIVVYDAGVSSGRDVAELGKLGVEDTRASRAIFKAKDSALILTENGQSIRIGMESPNVRA